jgi:hypothetical protein
MLALKERDLSYFGGRKVAIDARLEELRQLCWHCINVLSLAIAQHVIVPVHDRRALRRRSHSHRQGWRVNKVCACVCSCLHVCLVQLLRSLLCCGFLAPNLTCVRKRSHLQGMFYRTIRLIEKGLKPVFVFDGKPPTLKSGEVVFASVD